MLRIEEFNCEPFARSSYNSIGFSGAIVLGIGLAIGGCSADVLRADAPAFGLNGDPSPEQRTAIAGDRTDLDQRETPTERRTLRPGPMQYPAPVAGLNDNIAPVERGVAPTPASKPRFAAIPPSPSDFADPSASVDPSTSADNDQFAPVATGSLPVRGTITVEAGDTLYQLARRHGVSVDALRRANGINNNVIRPGQSLVLPGAGAPPPGARDRPVRRRAQRAGNGGTYTVRPGDSLYGISRRTGVSVAALKRLNDITDVRTLRPGTDLSLGRRSSSEPSRPARIDPRRRYVSSDTSRAAAPSAFPPAKPSARVASRTNYGAQQLIQAKPIKTVPISRPRSAVGSNSTADSPRILNQRPSSPIATRPKQRVAMVASPAQSRQSDRSEKFDWPAQGRLIAKFNHSGRGVKNDGINIAVEMGADVKAAGEGVVAYAGSELKGYGNLVLLRHDNGWVSAYAHASRILVKRGDRVSRGQVIARAGRSGDVSQPQLHFELRKGAKPVDPLPHLASL